MFASKRTVVTAVLAIISAAAVGACASDTDGSAGTSKGVRTVEIRALDTNRFEPSSLTAEAGEKIRFVVTNSGRLAHEFVLGDEDVQAAHEEQMGEMGHMQEEALAALELKAGETKEATVTLESAGTVLFGCHEPGHYQAGMVGTISVT